MRNAVIVDAVRTPVARRNGAYKDIHPVDLAAIPLKALMDRNSLDPGIVEDVIMGCVMQTGEQAYNVGRNAALAAGFPEDVVGTTIDRQCGSSQQSAHFAAQGVMAGAYDVVIAAGVESMTRIPMGVTGQQGPGKPFGPLMLERYAHGLVPQGISAEMIAEKWGISREELDTLALESHRRAARATEEGRFDTQLVPVATTVDGTAQKIRRDEGIRFDTTPEKLAGLQPAFKTDGVVTAGNSSQISDGAAAILIMGEEVAEKLGLTPLARFHTFSLAGVDPVMMLTGPIPATSKALDKSGLGVDDIDLFEVNEAFASVTSAWRMEHGGSDPMALWEKTNVNGGAIALGHPLGASGARLMTTMIHELVRTGGRYALQTMCEGGGMANGTIIESLV
ncbi:MAG: thiolase family protein [Acidimicrobiia bacterium]|nr:thiolase family protein [Acidimicrobiia bacterium]MDH4308556.1 thiolase family protein [Acidimicrobiia bacterium]MDH5294115.1 thiolase family protein [Acidimicrobiia bacterium]